MKVVAFRLDYIDLAGNLQFCDLYCLPGQSREDFLRTAERKVLWLEAGGIKQIHVTGIGAESNPDGSVSVYMRTMDALGMHA